MNKPLVLAAITALTCTALAAQTTKSQIKSVPVMLTPDTDHGTCSIGLQVNSDGTKLRSGPGTEFPVVAVLKAGHVVSGCNEHNGWDGVIDGLDESCSVGISVASKRPYSGPCASGWINQSDVTSIYG